MSQSQLSSLLPTPKSDEKVNVTINGCSMPVPAEYTVLDACRFAGQYVPTMCYHGRLKALGRCGVCAVEVDGNTSYACCAKIADGNNIITNSSSVRSKQAAALRAMNDRQRSRQIPLLESTNEFDAALQWASTSISSNNGPIVIDPSSCVDCGRCATACCDMQDMNILEITAKDGVRAIGGMDFGKTSCINCGQCTAFCPTGAIHEESHIERIRKAKSEGKIMVVQTAPAPRVALDEAFDHSKLDLSTDARTSRMVASLRALGFEYVFDTQFTADLTIMEEGTELIQRLTKKWAGEPVVLPQFTSCCPAWLNYVERRDPEIIPHLSSAKSPMMMLGALLKSYFPETILKTDPSNIYSVAVMPCTAKKHEITRDDFASVDAVLTTRELAKFIKEEGIDFYNLPAADFDNPLGESTGAGAIFGNSGGVMEAALRTAFEVVSGQTLPSVELNAVRGFQGIRDAVVEIPVGDEVKKVSVAICSGIKNAKAILKDPELKYKYDFIEVMSCPGGCICGGGQTKSLNPEIVPERTGTMYAVDDKKTLRKSHENPSIKKLYDEYLEEPCSHKAHHLLHTHYHDRTDIYSIPGADDGCNDDDHPEDEDAVNVYIVYATQTGNSKAVATTLADEIKTRGGFAKIAQADKISLDEVAKKKLVVFITSTFGQGELVDQALPLWEALDNASSGTLSNTQFAVFGLGSSAYPLFCKAAEMFDERFENLGGQRVIPLGTGDEKDAEGIWGGFGTFSEQLFDELGLVGDAVPMIPAPKYHVLIAASAAKGIPAPGYKYAKLTVNKIITPPHNDRLCRQIELDLRGTGLEYKTGWHCAILPRSLEKSTNRFINEILNLNPETVILVNPSGDSPVPGGLEHPTTLFEVFSQYIDISGRTTKNFLKALIPFAEDADQRAKLVHLVSKEGSEYLTKHYISEAVTYHEVLEEFDSCRPSVGHLISMIPATKPRLYSIASSHKMHPEAIQLTIGKVFWTTAKGVTRQGLTTNWLDHAKIDSKIAISVHSSPLVPPTDLSKPILMSCMGSGFAPFRGFLQDREVERDVEGNQTGKMLLFFGCRRPDEDWIHEDEMKQWEESGLTELSLAFSRVSGKKVYITHRAAERLEDLWELLGVQGGGFYYCGGIGPDRQLRNSIRESFIRIGGLTEKAADKKLDKMEHDGLLVLEAW
ncbi:hypothetical protein GEMRC1_008967 [Eukaryota sp. GEM-RC1]